MAGEPSTLTIRFEPGVEPIAGAIVADGEELIFSGWLQLASLIDRLRPKALPEDRRESPLNPRAPRPPRPPEALAGS